MQVNLDTTKGVRVVGGTGWAVNGQTVLSTGTTLSQFDLSGRITAISSANSTLVVMPFDGTIVSGFASPSGNPGAETVLTVTISGGSGNAGTFTIPNGTAADTNIAYVDGAGTATASAGTLITIVSDGGASNTVDGYMTLTVTRT